MLFVIRRRGFPLDAAILVDLWLRNDGTRRAENQTGKSLVLYCLDFDINVLILKLNEFAIFKSLQFYQLVSNIF